MNHVTWLTSFTNFNYKWILGYRQWGVYERILFEVWLNSFLESSIVFNISNEQFSMTVLGGGMLWNIKSYNYCLQFIFLFLTCIIVTCSPWCYLGVVYVTRWQHLSLESLRHLFHRRLNLSLWVILVVLISTNVCNLLRVWWVLECQHHRKYFTDGMK